MRTLARHPILFLILLVAALVVLWIGLYPDNGDPKNINYVLWKNHLNPWMNLDVAVGTMTHDRNSEQLVLGMNETELRKRFGVLRLPREESDYFQECAALRPQEHDKALFLRNSWYVVLFKNDIANELRLCKG